MTPHIGKLTLLRWIDPRSQVNLPDGLLAAIGCFASVFAKYAPFAFIRPADCLAQRQWRAFSAGVLRSARRIGSCSEYIILVIATVSANPLSSAFMLYWMQIPRN